MLKNNYKWFNINLNKILILFKFFQIFSFGDETEHKLNLNLLKQ